MTSGYDFYNNVLQSPKYVVAPMVDQSELAWRMFARKCGAHLCYTPMYSSITIVNDKNYRNKVLNDLSCCEDRPLIVQFCANDPDIFLQAAQIVEDHCDGVDLNLGCPQHIARRGHFGAFLQDDWETISKIVSVCKRNVSIGVTVKIRVFPDVEKSIRYAKMLESAGCDILTVHGRTREQKGLNTGLADWTQIKAIKDAISIPVFANGNILQLSDVTSCLEQTGVDGVMVAETHLHNPYLFQDTNPDVWQATEEYLSFAEKYPCPLAFIRSHFFRMWSNTLQVHKEFREKFGQVHSLKELRKCSEELVDKCMHEMEEHGDSSRLPHWKCQYYIRRKRSDSADDRNDIQVDLNGNTALHNGLEDDDDVSSSDESPKLSKNEMKRLKRYERKVYGKKLKRAKERENRKAREKNQIALSEDGTTLITKAVRKMAIKDRLQQAMDDDTNTIVVCVDLSWSNSMIEKEMSKLASQLCRLYGRNRQSTHPAHVYFSSFDESSFLYKECRRKHDGFDQYKVTMTSSPCDVIFKGDDVIFLSPDAEQDLESVDIGKTYIIGGLVDETVSKKLTLNKANDCGITARRLPVEKYMMRSEKHRNYSKVLAANQVFDILLTYHETSCWRTAFSNAFPARKGYVLKEPIMILPEDT